MDYVVAVQKVSLSARARPFRHLFVRCRRMGKLFRQDELGAADQVPGQ